MSPQERIVASTRHQVFFSFHYEQDARRVALIRENAPLPLVGNAWERQKLNTADEIEHWIDSQMETASCTVVLIGSETANRDWIRYEIEKSWKDEKGLLGVYIHKIPDQNGQEAIQGENPFDEVKVGGCALSHLVRVYDPEETDSLSAREYIGRNIARWVEDAIRIRNGYLD